MSEKLTRADLDDMQLRAAWPCERCGGSGRGRRIKFPGLAASYDKCECGQSLGTDVCRLIARIREQEKRIAQLEHHCEMACEKHNCFEDEQHPGGDGDVDPDQLCCGCLEVWKESNG
jgi:hypothetical protein